MIVVFA